MPKYTVAGEVFELLSAEDLLFAEARAIQKVTGVSLGALLESDGDVDALQGLLWVSMKRTRPDMKFSDLDEVPIGSIDYDDDGPEPEAAPDPTEGEETSPSSE